MNPKLLLCLALVLSGGLFGCSTTEQPVAANANTPLSSTNVQQSFESLLKTDFPGRNTRVGIEEDQIETWFAKLPLAQRNQLAVAAARELSLRTTNGDILIGDTGKAFASLTPAEIAMRTIAMGTLESDNYFRVDFLHEIAGYGLVTDKNVIPPLIEMLDEPIYNRALSPSEVRQFYDLMKP